MLVTVKTKTSFRCQGCGESTPKWVGRCPGCGDWNSLVEESAVVAPIEVDLRTTVSAVPIAEVDAGGWSARPTGISEVDRVLGGGLVAGSVTVVGGEPGVGKSTLLLQLSASRAERGAKVLYVSAEESAEQVRLRAERLDAFVPRLLVASETSLPALVAHLDEVKPDVVVVDSIQTVSDPMLSAAPGSVSQVRECANRLVREAKRRQVAVVLVGQVTKDGSLAGPRVLEHVVDTVLSFEGDAHHALRLLRATKHRFGSTQELGVFEMTHRGLEPVADPSRLFLADRRPGIPGSVVTPVLEGHRPLLVEVQALVAKSPLASPRRSTQGLDSSRLPLLLAVLQTHAGVSTADCDVYASVAGGVRVAEPAADLAVALAVTSSVADVSVRPGLVVCGEVGLGGEVRQIGSIQHRLAEAARLGFADALVPASVVDGPPGMRMRGIETVAEAFGEAL